MKSDADLIKELRKAASGKTGRAARWCREHDIRPSVVSSILTGRLTKVTPQVAAALGYKLVRGFVRADNE